MKTYGEKIIESEKIYRIAGQVYETYDGTFDFKDILSYVREKYARRD